MQTENIFTLVASAIFFITICIFSYKELESPVLGIFMMIFICILFNLAIVFGWYGISGIKYVYAANNILEMWARLWDGAAEVVSCQGNTFQDLVDEWVMRHG